MKKSLSLLLTCLLLFSFVGCSQSAEVERTPEPSVEVTIDTSIEVTTNTPTTMPEPTVTTQVTDSGFSGETAFGATVVCNGFELVFGDDLKWTTVDNQYSDLYERIVFGVPVTTTNLSGETAQISVALIEDIFSPDGTENERISSYFDDDIRMMGKLRNGAKQSGYIYFLYEGDGDYYMEAGPHGNRVELCFPVNKSASDDALPATDSVLEADINLTEAAQITTIPDVITKDESPPEAMVQEVVQPVTIPEPVVPVPVLDPEPEPTPAEEVYSGGSVWIPQSGSKHHSSSSCSGMKNPSQVSLSDAQSRGYTACSKCY